MASDRPLMALRTPLYLILAALGVVIVIATFMPWASVDTGGAAIVDGVETGATGLDAGGWGPAAIVAGLAIAVIGVIGYFWNPFSDPEAMFIAGFAAATVIASIAKIASATDLVSTVATDYYDASAGIGLWIIFIAAAICLAGSAWIVVSRPAAELRLAE